MTANSNKNSLPTILANPIIAVIFITALIFFIYGAMIAGRYYYPIIRQKYQMRDKSVGWSIPGPLNVDKATHMSRMAQVSPITAMPLPLPAEVYHIADQKYTYEAAKCKCANYGGRLATLEEVTKAYNRGAEWCSYGWTEGGLALYPTQPESYQKYREDWNMEHALLHENDKNKKKSQPEKYPFTHCGRPGLNGGEFNKNAKFGINCYGIKPPGYVKPSEIPKPPKPFPPIPQPKEDICANPQYQASDQDRISAFNKLKWSSYQ